MYITKKIYNDRWHSDTVIITDTLTVDKVTTKIKTQVVKKTDWKKTIGYAIGFAILIVVIIKIIRLKIKRV